MSVSPMIASARQSSFKDPTYLHYRVTPADSKDEVKSTVQSWLNDAGKDCTMSVTYDMPVVPMTSTDPSNPWWKAFRYAQCSFYIIYSNTCTHRANNYFL